MKITRRQLALAALQPAAALAQAPAIPATPEQELTAAREQVRRNVEALDKVTLPMSTEPAFQFRA